MPSTTHQAQDLAGQKAKLQTRIDALKQQQKRLDAKQARLAQQQTRARYVQVGKLVEAAGLLWAEDGRLEKILRHGMEETTVSLTVVPTENPKL